MKTKENLNIIYASQTGNSEDLAFLAHNIAKKLAISSQVIDIAELNVKQLIKIKFLMLVISTYGEGDMPDSAIYLANELKNTTLILGKLQFFILALGDSSYGSTFCMAGKTWENLLLEHKAKKLLKTELFDINFQQFAPAYVEKSYKKIFKLKDISQTKPNLNNTNIYPDKQLTVKLINKKILILEKNIHELTFSSEKDTIFYAGDTISIIPQNSNESLKYLFTTLNIKSDDKFNYLKQDISAYELFKNKLEINRINHQILNFLAPYSKTLCEINTQDEEQKKYFLQYTDLNKLLKMCNNKLKIQELIEHLPPISQRQYSIVETGKTVKFIQKNIDLSKKNNLYSQSVFAPASNFFMKMKIGDTTNIRVHKNIFFKIKNDTKPIIMIANGTGIGVIRGLLKELTKLPKRKVFVILGEQKEETIPYLKDITSFLHKNIITKFLPAYSKSNKEHIQDIILNNKELFSSILNENTYVYICGSVAMAENVKIAILQIISVYQGMSVLAANNHLNELKDKKIYLKDVY